MNVHGKAARKQLTLQRDCDALLIPSGHPILLEKDEEVTLMQALGDSFTIEYAGNLARIAGEDAAALGDEYERMASLPEIDTEASTEDQAWALMKTCYDPEIPVNIVDLGLIYACNVTDITDAEQRIHVMMTLTAPGCGMGPVLVQDIKRKLTRLPKAKDVVVELVFDPPWNQDMMSDVAKLQLGLF